MTRGSNIDRAEGGGPWRFELPHDLATSGHKQVAQYRLRRMKFKGQKGYFVPWLPLDQIQIKNLNDSNPVEVLINGQFNLYVESHGVETFSDAGITAFETRNLGGTAIPAGDIVQHGLVEPFGADQAAREEKKRSPVEKMIRGTLNL